MKIILTQRIRVMKIVGIGRNLARAGYLPAGNTIFVGQLTIREHDHGTKIEVLPITCAGKTYFTFPSVLAPILHQSSADQMIPRQVSD